MSPLPLPSLSFQTKFNLSRPKPNPHNDSLKRKRRQSILDKHYSTWHDQYAKVDRFFLYCTPFLFFIFNFFYWGYFYVWGLYILHGDNTEQPIEMPSDTMG